MSKIQTLYIQTYFSQVANYYHNGKYNPQYSHLNASVFFSSGYFDITMIEKNILETQRNKCYCASSTKIPTQTPVTVVCDFFIRGFMATENVTGLTELCLIQIFFFTLYQDVRMLCLL